MMIMVALYVYAVCFVRWAGAQGLSLPPDLTSFETGTGTRSLWIPFQTASSLSASIAGVDTEKNNTVYVIACATADTSCAIAPNITLTEGPTNAEYTLTNTNGAATINCNYNDTMTIDCDQVQRDSTNNNIGKTSTVLAPSQVVFQAVVVTATMTNSSTITSASSTPTKTSTLIMSTSGGAGPMVTAAPWAAVAGGIAALAAL